MRNKDGFTLLEVITGLAVIAIVSVSLLQMFLTSTRVGRKGFDVDQANMLAVKAVELFKLNPVALGESEMFDNGALGPFYTFEDTATNSLYRYYDFDWQPVEANLLNIDDFGAPADYSFQLVATTGPDVSVAGGSTMGLSYYPQLLGGSQISCTVAGMPAATKVEVSSDSGSISVKINNVEKGPVPVSNIASGVLPILVTRTAADPAIVFEVDNTAYLNNADLEVGLFVFGDDKTSPQVTLTPVNGLCSVTYLTEGQCNYSNYKADINIFRKGDASPLVTMQGSGYVAFD